MKIYAAPKLTVYGKVQDLTQVVGNTGGTDTFFDSDGRGIAGGSSRVDVRATSPVSIS
ncbi:lasso peptide [Chrysosporum bergii ANA360D]|jgi:hypothetical protein|uniref:Lasso peptide n=1 Tax=Chrysosporum bergii ANA360D TaxID=617107 RepID=A0AA43GR87_9CYAN|nr:lasso peptide [Chrysosporum bergii]MDH6060130.1 lasso peptide [Chrysosporum bergii ANA360D]